MKRRLLALFLSALLGACAQSAQNIVPILSQSQQLELACEEGKGSACFALGRLFLSNDAVSTRRAERAFESGCDLKYGQACLELGALSERQAEIPFGDAGQRHKRTLFNYRRACELGAQLGCQKLGRTLFFKANNLSDQIKGLRQLEQICDDGHHGGCIDTLRARLAQGTLPSSLLTSRLNVHCRTRTEISPPMDAFCARLRSELCSEDGFEAKCATKAREIPASIVDEPSCPAEDLPWILSVIHTNVQSCAEALPSQLRLHFDGHGKMSLGDEKGLGHSCLARRIKAMKILSLTTVDGCTLNVRF